jgi:hypothetical protein
MYAYTYKNKTDYTMKRLLVPLIFVSVFISCKKDKDDSLSVTVENLLGKYTLTSAVAGNQALYDQGSVACENDDEFELKADFIYKRYDTGARCGSDSVTTGMWQLFSNNNVVSFDDYGGKVEKLTSKTLVLSGLTLIGFQEIPVTLTFARK